jgi:hypothetical protein
MDRHTSVPRADQPPVRGHDTILQRGAVVRALGTKGLNLAKDIGDEHLRIEALHLHLLLLTRLEGLERSKAFQLVFLRHLEDSRRGEVSGYGYEGYFGSTRRQTWKLQLDRTPLVSGKLVVLPNLEIDELRDEALADSRYRRVHDKC